MQQQSFYITDYDMKRLRHFLGKAGDFSAAQRQLLQKLKEKLDKAIIIPQKSVPPYLVTMNSHVLVTDLVEQRDVDFWLAFEDEAMFGEHRLSILTELAIMVLGTKVGDKIHLSNGTVSRLFRVANIYYQPEASAHYKL